MLTRRIVPVICVALLFGCDDGSRVQPTAPRVTLSVDGNQSVAGHVEITYASAIETYTFSAMKRADGSVAGQWQSTVRWFNPNRTHTAQGTVTCFNVQPDGKTVWLGGITERFQRSGHSPIWPGTDAIWAVVDNGEGEKAPPDEATDLTYNYYQQPLDAAEYCTTGIGTTGTGCVGGALCPHHYPLSPVEGNIQVKP